MRIITICVLMFVLLPGCAEPKKRHHTSRNRAPKPTAVVSKHISEVADRLTELTKEDSEKTP